MRAVVAVVALCAAATLSEGISIRANPAPQVDMQDRLNALAPVLDKLRNLDPKTFGMLNGMINQAEAGSPKGTSFIQYLRDDPEEVQRKMEKLGPILEKLRSLDSRTFGALNSVISQVKPGAVDAESLTKKVSLIQEVEDPDMSRKLEALAPVLDKLKGLDGKTFGMLSNMMAQAEQQQGQQK
eukprot:TRINITY_DN982_c0_g1_i1.p1 TRINITY_DN982_c0_g1~~TRINITY_DN982_c0_g1_i1.p1  ORF type:complete len:183 (+),score=74.61 TRINITY_DN982_c0_g1_i1:93-641(+)